MKKNCNNFLVLKCLVLENRIEHLENKIIELEKRINEIDHFKIFSPQEIIIKPLPSLENTDVKEFHLEMKKITSYELID